MSTNSIRDFLSGRDAAIKSYDRPFDLAGNEDEKKGLCRTLITEYKRNCRKSQKTVSNHLDEKVTKSIVGFSKQVTKFVESLKDGITLKEAQTIMAAARFLRYCVAGRRVFTERCIPEEERDFEHHTAKNIFNTALMKLNMHRGRAIVVISKEASSATCKNNPGGKGKGKKKKVSDKPESRAANIYELISEPLTRLEEAVDELCLEDSGKCPPEESFPMYIEEEEKEGEGEETGNHRESESENEIIQRFLDDESTNMKDMVHDILQAGVGTDITSVIWGPPKRNRRRDKIYIPYLHDIALDTGDVYRLLYKTPRSRLFLYRLGTLCDSMVASRRLGEEQIPALFTIIVEFVTGLSDIQMQILQACNDVFFLSRIITGELPTTVGYSNLMRTLTILHNIDPLFVSYASISPECFAELFPYSSNYQSVAEVKNFRIAALAFQYLESPSLRELIEGGIQMSVRGLEEAMGRIPGGGSIKARELTKGRHTTHYAEIINNSSTGYGDRVRLPVEMIQGEDGKVRMKIHDPRIIEYVDRLASLSDGEIRVRANGIHVDFRENLKRKTPTILHYDTVVRVESPDESFAVYESLPRVELGKGVAS